MIDSRASLPSVLLFLVLALFLAPLSELMSQSSTLDRMREEVEELRAEVEALESGSQVVVVATKNIELARKEVEELKNALPGREKLLRDRFFLLNAYRSAYRVTHTIPVGQPLPTFVLRDGRSVSEGVFQGVERAGVKIATASGISVIPVEMLPSTLSGQFNLPSHVLGPSSTLDELIARKPAEIEVAGELASTPGGGGASPEPTGGETAPSAGSSTDQGKAKQKNAPTADERMAEIKAKEQRNRERWAEIDILRAEVNNFFFQRRDIERAKNERRREFDQRRIRPDPRTVEGAMKIFDDQLAKLEDEERGKMQRIRELQRDLE